MEADRMEMEANNAGLERTNSGSSDALVSSVASGEKPVSKVVARESKQSLAVQRDKTCPFLLRIFTRNHSHHRLSDFTVTRVPTEDELQIYTWRDATLKELATLIQEVNVDARRRDVSFSFQLIRLGKDAYFTAQDLGLVFNNRISDAEDKTLDQAGFVIGDYIDVSIRSQDDRRRHNHQGGQRPVQDRLEAADRDRARTWDRPGRGRR